MSVLACVLSCSGGGGFDASCSGEKGDARMRQGLPRSMDVVEKGVAQRSQWRPGHRELQGDNVNKETT